MEWVVRRWAAPENTRRHRCLCDVTRMLDKRMGDLGKLNVDGSKVKRIALSPGCIDRKDIDAVGYRHLDHRCMPWMMMDAAEKMYVENP